MIIKKIEEGLHIVGHMMEVEDGTRQISSPPPITRRDQAEFGEVLETKMVVLSWYVHL